MVILTRAGHERDSASTEVILASLADTSLECENVPVRQVLRSGYKYVATSPVTASQLGSTGPAGGNDVIQS